MFFISKTEMKCDLTVVGGLQTRLTEGVFTPQISFYPKMHHQNWHLCIVAVICAI